MTEPIPEQRRVLTVLVAAQILSGAGLAAGVTVGALLAQDMLGSTSLAGVPSALFTIGSAAAAVAVGRISQRAGRRGGLTFGYTTGAIGSAGVVAAAALDTAVLLFAALFVYGAGTATSLQARYAGADLAAPARRGRAVSTVLVATTLGAVVGPNLTTVMGDAAESWGIPRLSGPFVLSGVAYGLAAVVLWVLLRPDPLLLARSRAAAETLSGTVGEDPAPAGDPPAPGRPWTPAVTAGVVVMIVTQLVMVAVMTMTPIHMRDHGHDVGATGVVIAIHVAAMFLPSPIAGMLVDRVGPYRVAAAAGLVLLASGVSAALAPPHSVAALAFALGLLGFGWSLGLVSGTALVTDAVPLESRAATQGTADLFVALAGAGGGLGSGLVVAAAGFPALALTGAAVSLVILPVLARRSAHVAQSAVH
ncbi:MFS transporter [Rhodococcus aetherivorans]|uniref:MFS transporter n=1 Tax=Rhodococcus aetherivorans TaxID=191292 RepID=N1MAY7_9NOCA|nr:MULTISPECIES: MFS transporter [Rhodococcus]NCL73268.1 Riboflavin transporter RfnT [Rhodococcus sp. YH1]AKE89076.1 MFS transporter [Rhodococcus aetherivorans]ANZ26229.1 MFS transporter [Rhodococcus sp. WB1]MBC2591202.1 MFS transporter [Rhodococcus aetherivorans]UGQ40009.1 MFS transporter [Rhodococcus aetherivorans]